MRRTVDREREEETSANGAAARVEPAVAAMGIVVVAVGRIVPQGGRTEQQPPSRKQCAALLKGVPIEK